MSTEKIYLPRNQTFSIPKKLVKSAAYLDLTSANSVRVLNRFWLKAHWKLIKSTNKWILDYEVLIEFTYGEAERMGISNSAFARSLDDVIDHGFINVVESGVGVKKIKSLYVISERWKHWGTEQFVAKPRKKISQQYKKNGFQKGHPHYPPKKKK